jgi:hypothetical protein
MAGGRRARLNVEGPLGNLALHILVTNDSILLVHNGDDAEENNDDIWIFQKARTALLYWTLEYQLFTNPQSYLPLHSLK